MRAGTMGRSSGELGFIQEKIMTPKEFTRAVKAKVFAGKNFNKIFCIGANKTGTTTLETVLSLYGYNLPQQNEQEIRISQSYFSTDYTDFFNFVRQYDAFQDTPFSQGLVFVAADALFPNSKFILSERDSESWFNSTIAARKKEYKIDDVSNITESDILDRSNYLYKGYLHSYESKILTSFDNFEQKIKWDKLFDKDYHIFLYEERNNQVKKYFSDTPEKLLVIDVTKEINTQKICNFLNIPTNFAFNMPHLNKS